MELNEKFIRAKLNELKEAYMASGENAHFEYKFSFSSGIETHHEGEGVTWDSNYRKKILTIECGHTKSEYIYSNNYIDKHIYEINLDTLELECYIDDEFDHKDKFTTLEEMFDHIEQEVGVYESKKHIRGFGEFINERFTGLTGFPKVYKPQKFKDVLKVLKEVTDALEHCADDANSNVYDKYIELGRKTIKNAEK